MVVTLSLANGPQSGSVVRLSVPGRYIVGSGSTAHLRIPSEHDPYVSSQHALIELIPPDCLIRTLGGPNPVLVNGHRLREGTLSDGDILQVGFTRIAVRIVVPYCYWCGRCTPDLMNTACADGMFPEYTDVAIYSHPQHLPQGDEFKGQTVGGLTIQKKLGGGGFGSVFLAYDSSTSRVWAVKQMAGAFEASSFKRFEREGRFLTEYVHPKIARCVANAVDPRLGPYLVCELVPDGDLASFVRQNGPQEAEWTLGVMSEVLAALDFLHNRPNVIVHRDVKPHNVLLKKNLTGSIPNAKLADFGIARALVGPGSTRLTQAGGVPGTFFYLAPEVLLTGSSYGTAADVYSAGVTIYFVLTGRYPYEFPTQAGDVAMLFHLCSHDPIPIRYVLPGLPRPIADVIDKACRKAPDQRYPNAGALREALLVAKDAAD